MVVGAGIIGSSIAYQIARRSPQRVVVLEKGAGVAEGSTGASSSIVRCKYTYPEVVRLARQRSGGLSRLGDLHRARLAPLRARAAGRALGDGGPGGRRSRTTQIGSPARAWPSPFSMPKS